MKNIQKRFLLSAVYLFTLCHLQFSYVMHYLNLNWRKKPSASKYSEIHTYNTNTFSSLLPENSLGIHSFVKYGKKKSSYKERGKIHSMLFHGGSLNRIAPANIDSWKNSGAPIDILADQEVPNEYGFVFIKGFEQGDIGCGFHAIMNMILLQQYLIGETENVLQLNALYKTLLYSEEYNKNYTSGKGVYFGAWNHEKQHGFMELLINQLSNPKYTHQKAIKKRFPEGLLDNIAPIDAGLCKINNVTELQDNNFTYFTKIIPPPFDDSSDDSSDESSDDMSDDMSGESNSEIIKDYKNSELKEPYKKIASLLQKYKQQKKACAIPFILLERFHKFAMVIGQSSEGKRVYYVIESTVLSPFLPTPLPHYACKSLQQFIQNLENELLYSK